MVRFLSLLLCIIVTSRDTVVTGQKIMPVLAVSVPLSMVVVFPSQIFASSVEEPPDNDDDDDEYDDDDDDDDDDLEDEETAEEL